MLAALGQYLPILRWGRVYQRTTLANDLLAALIVTLMLIPQSLAYALLAGLPPEAGLYASVVPILLYAVFGSSQVLAVGPVAVVSLMSASALGEIATQGSLGYAAGALSLAALSGAMLLLLGLLRLGFLSNFLSHPVVGGFISASALIIAASQLGHLLGIAVSGHTLIDILGKLLAQLSQIDPITSALGLSATAALAAVRWRLKPWLQQRQLSPARADLVVKIAPVLLIVIGTTLTWALGLAERGVAIVGSIPQSLPPFTYPELSLSVLEPLLIPAFLIALIGFVESISVAQTLAAKKRQRIEPNQELIGLGMANLGAAFSGGFPVTGGFSRSVVNFDAGAQTPAAGAFTAVGVALVALFLTPVLFFLPKAVLAATIIVAVLSLVELGLLKRSWDYAKSDFAAVASTLVITLVFGVETGVLVGVGLSVVLHLLKTSRPHIAEVGLIQGTEHFRNVLRHRVQTHPKVLSLRVDESLYFANARFLEVCIHQRVTEQPQLRHVILQCSAVNAIDLSALESLEAINAQLQQMGVLLHLSELKGPVMDRLSAQAFLSQLSGRVFLTQFEAYQTTTTWPAGDDTATSPPMATTAEHSNSPSL